MPYSPQTWIDNNSSYPLSAARMNNIETGIQGAASVADQGHRILTTAQRDALGAVTAGTMIYNSTLNRVQVYYGGTWVDAEQFRTVGSNYYNNLIVPPSCELTRTTNQTIGTAGNTRVQFDTTTHDTDSMATTGASAKITINTAGLYLVTFRMRWANVASTTGIRAAAVWRNNSGSDRIVSVDDSAISSTNNLVLVGSRVISLTAGTTLDFIVYQSSGGNLDIVADATQGTVAAYMSATWIGRTS